ncbi:PaaI family thioesterase [Oceanibacterium hippocampi]|uniref:Thioesterase domain-containing protein n=1 Tax=Oceanibacterium hippocampi TaxID=745714 RepID=A0A1Y5SAA6_9PROT|nr:PaaI family thioesterase [Oceanibacterium hippocampi]SLN35387.1 hypothetical protein OCH7691_01409 [Oceanibacterium hippocampi]
MADNAGTGGVAGFDPARIEEIINRGIPHCGELGIHVERIGDGTCCLRLDYQERLVGDPASGVLHGGVITTLTDSVSGMSVYMALKKFVPIATLDLRIDYLRPSTPHEPLFAEAHCFKTTRQIAFVRGLAYNNDRDDPVASCAGTFMINSSDTPPLSGRSKQGREAGQ